MTEDILAILAGLGGLGAFVSILVNIFKIFRIVKDGTADKWIQGLNFLAFIAVSVVYFLNIQVDWNFINSILVFGTTALGFVVQMFGSQFTYTVVKDIPVIGYSHPKG